MDTGARRAAAAHAGELGVPQPFLGAARTRGMQARNQLRPGCLAFPAVWGAQPEAKGRSA